MSKLCTVNAWRFSLASDLDGKPYDQIAKYGVFNQGGDESIFDDVHLSEFVKNFASQKNNLPGDVEHQIVHAAANGQPPTIAATYDTLVLCRGGKVVEFATHGDAAAPNAAGWSDGVWGRRATLSPAGRDLLVNKGYGDAGYISPTFDTEAKDEQGRPLGYALLTASWTAVPFLDGMEPITFHRTGVRSMASEQERAQIRIALEEARKTLRDVLRKNANDSLKPDSQAALKALQAVEDRARAAGVMSTTATGARAMGHTVKELSHGRGWVVLNSGGVGVDGPYPSRTAAERAAKKLDGGGSYSSTAGVRAMAGIKISTLSPGKVIDLYDGGRVTVLEVNQSAGKVRVKYPGAYDDAEWWDQTMLDHMQMSAITRASRAFGGSMNPELLKKMGLADGATPADKSAAFARHAFDATPEELGEMADDLQAMADSMRDMAGGGENGDSTLPPMPPMGDDVKMRGMAEKFRKMAMMDVDPSNAAQNAAVHIKTGNTHDEGGRSQSRMSREDATALSRIATKFGLAADATPANIFAAVGASAVPTASLPAMIAEHVTRAVADSDARRVADGRVETLAKQAAAVSYPGDIEDLKTYARTNYDAAAKLVAPFAAQAARLFGRITAGGNPIGTGRPGEQQVADVLEQKGADGRTVVRFGRALSAAIKTYRAKNPALSYEAAAEAVGREQPHLLESYLGAR